MQKMQGFQADQHWVKEAQMLLYLQEQACCLSCQYAVDRMDHQPKFKDTMIIYTDCTNIDRKPDFIDLDGHMIQEFTRTTPSLAAKGRVSE